MRMIRGVSMLWLLALVSASGCNQQPPAGVPGTQTADVDAKGEAVSEADDHSGWWCVEHGIPEAECAQCSATVAADFKKKGDWCKAHNRPESQCFICHPDLKDKFAARYVAKFGKQPPPIEVEAGESDKDSAAELNEKSTTASGKDSANDE